MKNYWVDLRAKKERAKKRSDYRVRLGKSHSTADVIDTVFPFWDYQFKQRMTVKASTRMDFTSVSVMDISRNKEVYFEKIGFYSLDAGDEIDFFFPDYV